MKGKTYMLDTFWGLNIPGISYNQSKHRLYVFLGIFAFTIGRT